MGDFYLFKFASARGAGTRNIIFSLNVTRIMTLYEYRNLKLYIIPFHGYSEGFSIIKA